MKQGVFILILLILGSLSSTRAQDRQFAGLFVVKVNDRCGYIDKDGKIKIKPQFDGARDFSEGLAVIATYKGGYRVGYINESGNVVLRQSEVEG